MNSEAIARRAVARAGRRRMLAPAILLAAFAVSAEDASWRTVDQLTAEERALFDPATNTSRHAELTYAPAEAYPFSAPYTAEEMGYRASEFTHISRWPHSLIDVYGVITSSGYINQGAGISYVMQTTEPGFGAYIHGVKAGEVYSRWMIYSTFPPETESEQQLWTPNRTDAQFRTKMDFFIYSPQLRRVRRQPQPRRDQRFPDNAQTFDDVIGRDPWEFEWRLLGTDVIYETVRFPNTRLAITLNDATQGFVERQTATLKPMGDDYPHYRADGGVDCWVVKATTREDWLPGYNEKSLIYWLDKHYFYPIRTEKYDAKGELIMVEVRNAKLENPARAEFGYAALMSLYWDLPHDIMSYSMHDAHTPHEWTEEQKSMIFTPEFMRRQWLFEPLKTQALIEDPEHYFRRPTLDRKKFPQDRKIVLDGELEARVQAQESAGHLIFETPGEQTAQAR